MGLKGCPTRAEVMVGTLSSCCEGHIGLKEETGDHVELAFFGGRIEAAGKGLEAISSEKHVFDRSVNIPDNLGSAVTWAKRGRAILMARYSHRTPHHKRDHDRPACLHAAQHVLQISPSCSTSYHWKNQECHKLNRLPTDSGCKHYIVVRIGIHACAVDCGSIDVRKDNRETVNG